MGIKVDGENLIDEKKQEWMEKKEREYTYGRHAGLAYGR